MKRATWAACGFLFAIGCNTELAPPPGADADGGYPHDGEPSTAPVAAADADTAHDAGAAQDAGAEPSSAEVTGTVSGTGGAGLNVRALPATSSAVVTWLSEGASFAIDCQVEGELVSGTNVWSYSSAHGGYLSDAFVDTGHDGFVPGIARCAEAPGGGSGDGPRLTLGEIVGPGYRVTQDYGPTSFDGGYSYCHAYGSWGGGLVHCGIDIGIAYGTALRFPEDGTVLVSGETRYYEDETNPAAGELRLGTAEGTEIILGHMSRIDARTGQTVARGAVAGLSGTANGPHVHIEVRVRDTGYASGFRTVDPAVYFGL